MNSILKVSVALMLGVMGVFGSGLSAEAETMFTGMQFWFPQWDASMTTPDMETPFGIAGPTFYTSLNRKWGFKTTVGYGRYEGDLVEPLPYEMEVNESSSDIFQIGTELSFHIVPQLRTFVGLKYEHYELEAIRYNLPAHEGTYDPYREVEKVECSSKAIGFGISGSHPIFSRRLRFNWSIARYSTNDDIERSLDYTSSGYGDYSDSGQSYEIDTSQWIREVGMSYRFHRNPVEIALSYKVVEWDSLSFFNDDDEFRGLAFAINWIF